MSADRVLQILAAGGHIEARRAYPCPHRFDLVKADGHTLADPLSAKLIADLVEAKKVVVTGHDRWYDSIDYAAAGASNEIAKPEDPQELDHV